MNVCVSGASGFIGSRLVKQHLAAGDSVRYLTRSRNHRIPGVETFVGDITEPAGQLISFLEEADVFYHCAGEVYHKHKMRETHVEGTQNLLDAVNIMASHSNQPPHWIQLSSCGAYGQSKNPATNRFIDENTEENPHGEYECTKTESDCLVIGNADVNPNFKYSIIRPTIVFGVGMRSTAIKRLASIVNKGFFFYVRDKNTIANYVHVEDVVSAMMLSAGNSSAFNQTFIVSNDCRYQDMVTRISVVLGAKLPDRVFHEYLLRKLILVAGWFRNLPITQSHIDVMVRKTTYSNNKLTQMLGWSPASTVLDQIAKYIEQEAKTDG